MDDYKEIKELLKPRRDIKASDELRLRVHRALDSNRRKRFIRNWIFRGIGVSAIAAVLLIAFLPSGMSAKDILSQTIKALENAKNIEMIVEVRTRPMENFRYIDIHDDFVVHRIDIADSDSLSRWRIDKGERVAMCNSKDIYTWIPALKIGFHIHNNDSENILGYMSCLLSPQKILETELDNCLESGNAEYHVEKVNKDIVLTIHDQPYGNFENPYLLNTSIAESENIRRYVIDATSKMLKSATVSIISGNREIVVLQISSINYHKPAKDITMLADGIKFVETENMPEGLMGLSAEEAASTVLNAFTDWNDSILDKVMIREVSDITYREKFKGSKLISVGRSFTSGIGKSIFVPYTLELRDGTVQRHNISLQKNDSGAWIVAGGL